MLDRIFPKQFDNTYRGHWLGVALFVPIVLLKAIQGVNSIIMTRQIMTSADGIPLDSFNSAAAQNAIADFALLGMYLLIIPLIGAISLIRYRAMIPFLYLMLLLQQIGSRFILLAHPVPRTGAYDAAPIGLYVNLGILAVTVIGFALSLLSKRGARAPALAENAS
ncbi:MAG TPA: hypothetical protein VL286_08680 [Rhizomicrobium sp.]|jgi:hypothetical protein|nr:hypothetical protein [Rhizomicrobium sp.]